MSYIGNTNTTQAFTPAVDYFSGNASTTAFTLSRPVASVAQVQVVVNNVAQNPSDAYTVSVSTITFTSAPSSGTNNIYVYYTSPITQVIAPSQGTVGTTQIQNGVTVNFADGSAAAPSITNDGDTNTGIFFPAADTIAFAEGGTEVMRINSSGNVGIGTSLPVTLKSATTLQVLGNIKAGSVDGAGLVSLGDTSSTGANAGIWRGAAGAYGSTGNYLNLGGYDGITFTTGNADIASQTERMRIDSSGNLLVGTTSATLSSRLRVKSSDNTDNTYTIYVDNSSATPLFSVISDGDFNTGTATHSPYNYTTSNAANMVVESNGLVKRSTSSLKYKTDVTDATHGLADLLKLRSVTYKGKNDGGTIFGGLIAEEVHAVGLTEFVQYAEDGSPDALAYANMVSLCVKAIQEQQALITALTARITALENT